MERRFCARPELRTAKLVRSVSLSLAVCVTTGCTTSPLDPIVAVEPAADGGGEVETPTPDASTTEAEAPDSGGADCDVELFTPFVRYVITLRYSAECLSAGVATMIGTEDGFTVELTEDCTPVARRLWTLMPADFGSYRIRNAQVPYNLDIEFASSRDGTRAVLFGPHQFPNQRFFFRPRNEGFELAPGHAVTQCLSETGSGAAIWPCSDADIGQEWVLRPEACL